MLDRVSEVVCVEIYLRPAICLTLYMQIRDTHLWKSNVSLQTFSKVSRLISDNFLK